MDEVVRLLNGLEDNRTHANDHAMLDDVERMGLKPRIDRSRQPVGASNARQCKN